MKKLFTLLALMLLVLGAHQSAMANVPVGALHQHPALCQYGYNPNCYPSGSSNQPTQVVNVNVYNYLNLLWTNGDGAYFYKTYRKTPYANDFDFAQADQDALNACNANADLRPCRHATSTLGNDSCIAYMDTPDVLYSQAGNTCQEAKQAVHGRCMARYQNRQICGNIHTKQPFELD